MKENKYRDLFYKKYSEIYWKTNDKNNSKKESMIYDYIYNDYLPENKDGIAIDCGSGGGLFLYYLKRKGYNKAFGVDLCKEFIEYQKNYLQVNSIYGDAIKYIEKFKRKFELIVATDIIEHLKKHEIIDFVSLASEKLSPTGRFFVQVPNMGNPFTVRTQFGDFTHEVAFTDKSLEALLLACGFEHVHIISSYPFNKEPESMNILRDLYLAVGNAQPPKILSKNLVAICGHEPIPAMH